MKVRRTYRFRFLLILLAGLFSLGAVGQIKVSGTVKDSKTGEALPAFIKIKGTNPPIVEQADGQGNFTIMVNSPQDILEVSMYQYTPRSIQVNNSTYMVIAMDYFSTVLDDVVILVYTTTQVKNNIVGQETLDPKKIKTLGTGSLDKLMQGAGSVLVTSNGNPGKGSSMKIRGLSSINANSEPLIVLDGLPLDNQFDIGGISPMFSINPDDIEYITVLKDAAATAMFGSRGANGVIMITTKRGKSGANRKPQVSYSSYVGVNVRPKKYDMMNADQYCSYMDKLYANFKSKPLPTAFTPDFRSTHGNVNTDWQDAIYQPGPVQNHSINIGAGGVNSNYNLSANYYNEKGILKTTGSERFNIRLNSDFVLSKKLKVGESMMLSRINSDLAGSKNGNPWYLSLVNPPVMPIYEPANLGGYAGPTDSLTGDNDNTNPVAELMLNKITSQMSRFLIDAYTELEIVKGLKYKVDAGYDFTYNHYRSWQPEYVLGNKGNRSNYLASLTEDQRVYSMWKLDNLLTYQISFGGDTMKKDTAKHSESVQEMIDKAQGKNHNFYFLIGQSAQEFRSEYYSSTGLGFQFPDLNVLDMSESSKKPTGSEMEYAISSYMGRVMYDYKAKYLFTASLRRDGSSKFGPNNRIGYFPAFSAGWKLNEDLCPTLKDSTINMIKVRAGWGQTGNQNFPAYRDREFMDPLTHSRYVFGIPQTVYRGYQLYSSTGNPNLKWEASTMTNMGADFSFFRHKLEFSADYYIKNQKNMLVQQMLPLVVGRLDVASPWVNLGEVQNKGFEFNATHRNSIKINNSDKKIFEYSVSANFTTIKNRVVKLPGGTIYQEYNTSGATTVTAEGHTIGSFYGYVAEGIFQSDEEVKKSPTQMLGLTKAGDIKFKDLNGDGKIDASDRTIIGKAVPDYIYGISFYCSYKGFDLNVMLQGIKNVQIYNGVRSTLLLTSNTRSENRLAETMNYWTPENPSTTVPGMSYKDNNDNDRFSTFFLEDGSYLRIKNIQVGYTFPAIKSKLIDISRLRLYLSGTNVWTFTKYKGIDPDIVSINPLMSNFDYGNYPVPRIFLAGVQVDF